MDEKLQYFEKYLGILLWDTNNFPIKEDNHFYYIFVYQWAPKIKFPQDVINYMDTL
jgi:hypothetical protein